LKQEVVIQNGKGKSKQTTFKDGEEREKKIMDKKRLSLQTRVVASPALQREVCKETKETQLPKLSLLL